MPKKRSELVIEAAKVAADRLAEIGEHKLAEDVRRVCRGNSMLILTAATLHRELEETRRAAGMPTWDRAPTEPPRRCETNTVVGQLAECAACGAANGEACRQPKPAWDGETF